MFGFKSALVWFKFVNWARRYIFLLKGDTFSNQYKFLALKNIAKEGVLEYFKEPHSKASFINDFDLAGDVYLDYLLFLLTKDGLFIRLEDDKYQLNSPSQDRVLSYLLEFAPDEIPDKIPSFIIPADFLKDLNEVFLSMGDDVFPRLKGSTKPFTGGVQLFNWDSAFGISLYQTGRDCSLFMANGKKIRNGRILDIGCGNGYGTADIWGRFHSKENMVYAIDANSDLLAIASTKSEFEAWLKMLGFEAPQNAVFPIFKEMDAHKLDFDDNYFDLAHMSLVLHWLSDPGTALKEVYRVVKPGGRICGTQGSLQPVSYWLDLLLRTVEGSGGHLPERKLRQLFVEAGFKKLVRRTAAGFFVAEKPK
ncbi:MAG: class I SAM-dependent methyltransferase, partial [Candidatus Hodarchaeota archaeon]